MLNFMKTRLNLTTPSLWEVCTENESGITFDLCMLKKLIFQELLSQLIASVKWCSFVNFTRIFHFSYFNEFGKGWNSGNIGDCHKCSTVYHVNLLLFSFSVFVSFKIIFMSRGPAVLKFFDLFWIFLCSWMLLRMNCFTSSEFVLEFLIYHIFFLNYGQ